MITSVDRLAYLYSTVYTEVCPPTFALVVTSVLNVPRFLPQLAIIMMLKSSDALVHLSTEFNIFDCYVRCLFTNSCVQRQ